jgi:PAS domain S-box-containing protein
MGVESIGVFRGTNTIDWKSADILDHRTEILMDLTRDLEARGSSSLLVRSAEGRAANSAMNKSKKDHRPQVLVLDSQPRVRGTLEEILNDIIVIHVAETPEQALETLKQHPVAVIVTDQRWISAGHDLLADVSNVSPATRVILTGFSDPDEVLRAVDRGHIYAYLAKPWEPLELRLTITQAATHYKLVQELNLERLHFQQLMDNIPDVIYFKDSSGCFTRVNKAKAALIGVTDPSELIGKGDWQFFSHEEASRIQAEDDVVILRGEAVVDELHSFTPPDGRPRWFSTSKVPLSEEMGGGLVGLSRDITLRKHAEERLQEVVSKLVEAEKDKREFCAQVVLAVTEGALHLVEHDQIPDLPNVEIELDLEVEENYHALRERLRELGTGNQFSEEETEDLVLAAGEAVTNAIKHAKKGWCQVGTTDQEVIVRVSDEGEGIHPDALPETLFQTGFSTKISLGLGYTLLLKLVDEMWLATGPQGTVLQLIKRKPSAEDDEAALMALLDRF